MIQLESEQPKIGGPNKWGKQPRIQDTWIISHKAELAELNIDVSRYRTGMAGAFLKDSNTALAHAAQFLDPNENLPPFFREKVPTQQENFKERVKWLISTGSLPDQWNKQLEEVLAEADKQPWNESSDLITVEKKWNDVICEYNVEVAKKDSPFKSDMDYYFSHYDTVGQKMQQAEVKL